MGRITNLPDDIVHHIVSLLSEKEAARAHLVSKNWLNLIYIILNLEFDSKSKISGRFEHFVDELLDRHADHRLRRFSLKLPYVGSYRCNYVNDCLRNVLKRGVLDLELHIKVKEDYSLPFEVFTCKSVVTLKLVSGFVIDIIHQNALLPSLKTLILDSVWFDGLDGGVFQRLLSACPVLEELVIDGSRSDHWNWFRTVSSQILKRLTIRRKGLYDVIDTETISFDTPSLEYLEYSDVRDEYPVVNFNSLVEAKLVLPAFMLGDAYNLTNLIKGLKNVQILRLVYVDTLQPFDAFREAVPWFENLFHLEVTTESFFCWGGLVILLQKSPNLKTLTIDGTLHYLDLEPVCKCLMGYSFLMSCPIETLKITEFRGNTGEMVQIKHVLQNLPRLELLEVHVQASIPDKKLQIMSDLLMLPRASSKCRVHVIFS